MRFRCAMFGCLILLAALSSVLRDWPWVLITPIFIVASFIGLFWDFIVLFWMGGPQDKVVCNLAGLKWNEKQICFNSLVTGAIGSGKTKACLVILDQLFANVTEPKWGGLVLDYKGDFHLDLLRIAEKHGRKDDVVILEVPNEGKTVYAPQRINLLTAGGISPGIVARILADMSFRMDTGGKNSGFFRQQTETHIAGGIHFLNCLGAPATIQRLYRFLCEPNYMVRVLKSTDGLIKPVSSSMLGVIQRSGTPSNILESSAWEKISEELEGSLPSNPFARRWVNDYLHQPPDQRGGVVGSIVNALSPFLAPDLAEIFSSDEDDTVDFADIEEGKIICVVCPHALAKEKGHLNQYFKSLYFNIGTRRYDLRKEGIYSDRLLVCFADEYQKISSPTDRHSLDILRDARCCFLAAMQDTSSLSAEMSAPEAKVILGKFRNRLIFASESWDSSKEAADVLGTKRQWKKTYSSGKGGGSRSRSEADEPILRPEYFHRLRNHRCIIVHASKRYKKDVKLPLV